jgi:hypothetical protein
MPAMHWSAEVGAALKRDQRASQPKAHVHSAHDGMPGCKSEKAAGDEQQAQLRVLQRSLLRGGDLRFPHLLSWRWTVLLYGTSGRTSPADANVNAHKYFS